MLRNRHDAGRFLGELLANRQLRNPLVLGIPRGGVVIACAVAEAIHGEVDVVLARKLRAPDKPEFAIGSVDEDGEVLLLPFAHELLDAHPAYLAREIAYQRQEIERRRSLYRAVKPAAAVTGRSVIVTDDGIATGSTILAALHSLRVKRPHETIVAVPVAAPERLSELRGQCSDVICLSAPPRFRSISEFYEDFDQVGDDEVLRMLGDSRYLSQAANMAATQWSQECGSVH